MVFRRFAAYRAHTEVYAMRTNIVLNDPLVEDAMRVTQSRSKREVVELALRELVARRRQRALWSRHCAWLGCDAARRLTTSAPRSNPPIANA